MDEKSIKILMLITEFGPITGPNLLALLEKNDIKINIKTIHGIVDKWNYLFSKIGDGTVEIINQKKIGYQLNHHYFSEGQRLFLKDMISSSSLLNPKEKQHFLGLCQLFPKVENISSESGFLHRLDTIYEAISQKRTIKFSYVDYYVKESKDHLEIKKKYRESGNLTKDTYLISPYEIVLNRGLYYVLSYCDKHPDNVTIFRLDRMDKVRLSKETYFENLKQIVNYDEKKKQMIHMFIGQQEPQHVRIKFKKESFKTVVDEFGTDIVLSKDLDGTPILELDNFAISEGLVSWIMMMGDQVEVIAPTSLRQEIIARLQQLLKKYL